MADTSNLSKFLTDIADAIRTKKETTEPIAAEQFDQEILSIEAGIDTSDATATANDIAEGKTVYINGKQVSGTLPEVSPNTFAPSDYTEYEGIAMNDDDQILGVTGLVQKDYITREGSSVKVNATYGQIANGIGLTPNKLVSGNTVLGVEGTAEIGGGVDTSDATATARDIAMGKTAYANGEKITGSVTIDEVGFAMDVGTVSDISAQSQIICNVSTDVDRLWRNIATMGLQVPYEKVATAIKLSSEQIAKGNTILGIEGTAESGSTTEVPVKLFATVEEMQADASATEGDLAVVYREAIQNATVSSKFNTAIFPNTVVLPEAMTDYIDFMYRATDDSVMLDCWGQLAPDYFSMSCYTDATDLRIQYESSDGITYTRTDGGDEVIDFGTEIYCAYEDFWNDAVGYFIQTGGKFFEGLYIYTLNYQTDNVQFPDLAKATTNYTDNVFEYNGFLPELYSVRKLNKIKYDTDYAVIYVNTANELKLVCDKTASFERMIVDENNEVIGLASIYTSATEVKQYTVNLETMELTDETILPHEAFNSENRIYVSISDMKSPPISLTKDGSLHLDMFSGGLAQIHQTGWRWATDVNLYVYADTYIHAPTQLTLNDEGQLLPGKLAYGKNGVITGDGSIYDNLDSNILMETHSSMQNVGNILRASCDFYGERNENWYSSMLDNSKFHCLKEAENLDGTYTLFTKVFGYNDPGNRHYLVANGTRKIEATSAKFSLINAVTGETILEIPHTLSTYNRCRSQVVGSVVYHCDQNNVYKIDVASGEILNTVTIPLLDSTAFNNVYGNDFIVMSDRYALVTFNAAGSSAHKEAFIYLYDLSADTITKIFHKYAASVGYAAYRIDVSRCADGYVYASFADMTGSNVRYLFYEQD